MSLYNDDPDNVWAYFESVDGPNQVMLPQALAVEICEFCRHLIPDTPAGCCAWCTFDLTGEEEDEYRGLIVEFEQQVLAALDGADPSVAGCTLEVVETGDIVEVVAWSPGQPALVRCGDGGVRLLQADEVVRPLPPSWSLTPAG